MGAEQFDLQGYVNRLVANHDPRGRPLLVNDQVARLLDEMGKVEGRDYLRYPPLVASGRFPVEWVVAAANGIPFELTATPCVGAGTARRQKIALAVLVALEDAGALVACHQPKRPVI